LVSGRICLKCNSNTTFKSKEGWAGWYRYEDGWICKSCYMKLVNNPKWQKTHSKIYSPRRLTFKDKRIRLTKNPRTGQCQICKLRIGDEFINRYGHKAIIKHTHLHHAKYHNDDPMKGTIELCNSCHSKITRMVQLECKDAYQRKK
jgi:hypothetical protein